MFGQDATLRIRVADIKVGVVNQVDAPVTLRMQLDIEGGAVGQLG